MPAVPDGLLVELRDLFVEKFGLAELNDFAFDLGVNPDTFETANLPGRARELATHLSRHDMMPTLLAVGKKRRPDIDWTAVLRAAVSSPLLEPGEQDRLVLIVAGLQDMALGPATRLQLLRRAHLGSIAPRFELAQPPAALTPQLVELLQTLEPLPVQPNYEPLGLLLVEVLNDSEVPDEDKRFMAELLVKYSLIADLDKLDELKKTFIVKTSVVRSVDASRVAPRKQPLVGEKPQTRGTRIREQQSAPSNTTISGDFLDVEWLAGALYAGQAVGRIESPAETPVGTGFLIAPDLVLTCQYVLPERERLSEFVIRFDYTANADGVVNAGRLFEFDPDFYESSPLLELDFTLARLKEAPLADKAMLPEDEGLGFLELLQRGRHRGYLLLASTNLAEHDPVAIVQHANGEPLKVTMDNVVVAAFHEDRVHYLGDTMPGSGGAPVLDRSWQVAALHHARGMQGGRHQPDQDAALKTLAPLEKDPRFKEGIPIRAILPLIEQFLPHE